MESAVTVRWNAGLDGVGQGDVAAGVPEGGAAREQDEGRVADHGQEQGQERAHGYAAGRVFEVAGYVGARLDPRDRGEEYREYREEGLVHALRSSVVRGPIALENVRCYDFNLKFSFSIEK